MKNNGLFAVIVALNGDTPPPPLIIHKLDLKYLGS